MLSCGFVYESSINKAELALEDLISKLLTEKKSDFVSLHECYWKYWNNYGKNKIK